MQLRVGWEDDEEEEEEEEEGVQDGWEKEEKCYKHRERERERENEEGHRVSFSLLTQQDSFYS